MKKEKQKKVEFGPEHFKIMTKWKSFALAVLPADAPEHQYNDMRMAFIGGAWSSFTILQAVALLDEEQAVEVLQKYQAEIEGILAEITGKGGKQ